MKSSPPSEDYTIRCPKLGHQIAFSYCRFEQTTLPCSKILDCWFEHFDVESYINEILTPEAIAKLVHTTRKPKVLSLVELIEQAKKSAD